MVSDWPKFNKFKLKYQQWQLLYKCSCWLQSLRYHTCYLIDSLSHCVVSETFSDRNKSIDCALVRVSIARDSESEHPFYPVEQFHRSLIFCDNCFSLITLQFLLRNATEQMQAIRSACSRAFRLIQTSPSHANIFDHLQPLPRPITLN